MATTRRTALALLTTAAATAALVLTTTTSAHAELAKPTSTAAQHVTRTPSATPLLTGIRAAKHDTFDRVVLDLKGAAPGYDVRYVSTVRYDASGKTVSMPTGSRYYLQLVLKPAAAHDTAGHATYTGSRRITTSLPTLKGIVLNGDNEAVLSIALGLSKKAGFRVMTLANPTRIVVDVAH